MGVSVGEKVKVVVCGACNVVKKPELLDNKLSGGHFVVFQNPQNINTFDQTGKVEFLA